MKLTKLFAIAISIALINAAEANAQVIVTGDCVVGANFSDCQSYLTMLGRQQGFDYLSNVACPNCIDSENDADIVIAPDGTEYLPMVCRADPQGQAYKFGEPNFGNLTTSNPLYRLASSGDHGALVTSLGERVCWEGGVCLIQGCIYAGSGDYDPLTGDEYFTIQCQKSHGRVLCSQIAWPELFSR